MAMNDISLTSGMRSNLVQLQATVALLDRTQERLATGKKVNSPLDNPINFFAAQGHLSRASDIAQYKDGMAEGVQTIQAANAGIKGIQGLIEAARSLAQSALASNPNQMSFTMTKDIAENQTVVVGGTTFTGVTSNAGTTSFMITESDGTTQLSADEIVANLAAKINGNTETGVAGNLKALYSGNRMTLQATAIDSAITGTGIVGVGTAGPAVVDLDADIVSERETLALQYETLLGQIDTLAGTAGYKGTNLLTKDTLGVTFEGGSISVKGFNAYASDLGVNTSGTAESSLVKGTGEGLGLKWALANDIKLDITNMDKGVAKLKTEASKLSSAISVINIQQDFSTTKINLLTKGADNLTAADTNEEGANMLMLQTRQALSTTALSLSAQASQSVLRLFA